MSDDLTLNKLLDGNVVYLYYWNMADPHGSILKQFCDKTILPGRNEKLSSSSVSGYSIGINSLLEIHVSKDKEVSNVKKFESSINVTEFLNYKDTQRIFLISIESIVTNAFFI